MVREEFVPYSGVLCWGIEIVARSKAWQVYALFITYQSFTFILTQQVTAGEHATWPPFRDTKK